MKDTTKIRKLRTALRQCVTVLECFRPHGYAVVQGKKTLEETKMTKTT